MYASTQDLKTSQHTALFCRLLIKWQIYVNTCVWYECSAEGLDVWRQQEVHVRCSPWHQFYFLAILTFHTLRTWKTKKKKRRGKSLKLKPVKRAGNDYWVYFTTNYFCRITVHSMHGMTENTEVKLFENHSFLQREV